MLLETMILEVVANTGARHLANPCVVVPTPEVKHFLVGREDWGGYSCLS